MASNEERDMTFTDYSGVENKLSLKLILGGAALLIVALVIGFAIINITRPGGQSTAGSPETAEARTFIIDFTLHFYNLSAGFFEQERDKAANLMSADVLKAYQTQFYDTKLLEKINKHRLSTSYDIQRLDLIGRGKTEYQFRVIGNMKYTSLTLNTYVQYPFANTLTCAKTSEGWRITNITTE